jgi:hypothetical protein
MSELNNPLFENQKEFLERQKEEYKNALLSDVTQIKAQSQQVGKTILIAGGALAGVWFLSSMLRGKKKSKPKKSKLNRAALPSSTKKSSMPSEAVVNPDGSLNYQEVLQAEPVYETHYFAPQQESGSTVKDLSRSFFESDMVKALSQQVTAFLLIYITKKIEEYLQETKSTDIASSKEPETKDINFSYHKEDAVQ